MVILVRAIAPADGWDDAALAAAQPATPKRYRVDTRATLRRQIAFDRTPYYIVASCFAEQSNIQGAVAQLVERFVRIEEVAVSTTVNSAISRFKGLIWGLPEVYLRFEGLMVK
ncbi:MAG: hypothetical protein E7I22_05490 [Bifidobacterium longum]|nr:hypothetical protein [Bifidobacterium longum]